MAGGWEWPLYAKIFTLTLLACVLLQRLFLKCYVMGSTEESALQMVMVLHKLGFGVISDFLGEEVKTPADALKAAKTYLRHTWRLKRLKKQYPGMRLAISVKLSQLGLKLDKNLARYLARRIALCAAVNDIELELDMEGPETIDDTADVGRSLLRHIYTHRQALPVNQIRSQRVAAICAKLGTGERIVMGAYPGDIRDKNELEERFFSFVDQGKRHSLNVAIGTHDHRRAMRAIKHHRRTVWQMLYGVRMFLQTKLAKKRLRRSEKSRKWVRNWIYGPWGTDSRGYLLRRGKEGLRPEVLVLFLLNIPESLLWRLRYAPLSFFKP